MFQIYNMPWAPINIINDIAAYKAYHIMNISTIESKLIITIDILELHVKTISSQRICFGRH